MTPTTADIEALCKSAAGQSSSDSLAKLRQEMIDGDADLKQIAESVFNHKPWPVDPSHREMFWGVIPAFCHYPPADLPSGVDDLLKVLTTLPIVNDKPLVPATTFTKSEWANFLKAVADEQVIDPSGRVYAPDPYMELDWHWIYTLFNTYLTEADTSIYKTAGAEVTPSMPDDVTIAIVGDWGTGDAVAKSVATAIGSVGADYIIHLGDVYYAGTGDLTASNFYDFGEEQANLVNVWPAGKATGLTLNSNHEMYSRALGYFNVAMKAGQFKGQQGSSFFVLENNNWQIFGLDSAWAAAPPMYGQGQIDSHQIEFVQKCRKRAPDKNVVIMTHHNPLSYSGNTVNKPLCSQVVDQALSGTAPDYWYWGHVHLGVVYNSANLPAPLNATQCRCVGHGAIPFGVASGLCQTAGAGEDSAGCPDNMKPRDTVTWFAHNKRNNSSLVKNGFAVITLTGKNIVELFRDENGDTTWSSQ